MPISVAALDVADPPAAWTQAGFTVGADAHCRIGDVVIQLVGRDRGAGILGWSLRGLPPDTATELDGISTRSADTEPAPPATHPNGVTAIDHVVVLSPNVDRTVAALGAVGAAPRRERNGELGGQPIRQVFFRFGTTIVELVGSPTTVADGPATLWGITYVVADIDDTAAYLGERTSAVKDAVQPGRRITTLRHREFGMSVRTAMISP